MATIIKFKRGQSASWVSQNPVLQPGEPGFELDTGRLKIGNGKDAWLDLPYLGEDGTGVVSAATHLDFPSIGNVNYIYKATEEKEIYQWNETTSSYEIIGSEQLISDEQTIITNNNMLSLKGFAEAENGQQLRKNAEGELEWFTPPGKDEIIETVLSKEEATIIYEQKRYEISSLPKGAVVDYSDKEIRIFCPKNTEWIKQNVGATGNANMYYVALKAYAPKEAVSFKEGEQGAVTDTIYDFNDDFAGIDSYGRKYSIVWLPVANYNESTKEWTYYGEMSSTKRYIGWTYAVEWYDVNGIMIESDIIKINLSNENCHSVVEPYYMASINVDKLVQDKDSVLILYGGSATDNL